MHPGKSQRCVLLFSNSGLFRLFIFTGGVDISDLVDTLIGGDNEEEDEEHGEKEALY